MIFFTSYYEGTHGSAKSAKDFLIAISAFHKNIVLISPSFEKLPDFVVGYKLNKPKWIQLPYFGRKYSFIDFFKRNHIINNFKELTLLLKFERINFRDTVIVNGWASIQNWNYCKSKFKGRKGLIVRESVRHFEGSDQNVSVKELLNELKTFDFLIFVSDNVRKEWLQLKDLATKPNFLLPNCCEEEEALKLLSMDKKQIRIELGLSLDEILIVCPGSIEIRKGQDLFLEISKKLLIEIPNIRILLVGDAASEWGVDFVKKIRGEKFSKFITHIPAMPSALKIIYASDILAFPTKAEALPRTILEAMCLKVPIVSTNVDGIPELVINNQTGILFESGNAEGLHRGIIQFVTNPVIAEQFANESYNRYWKHYTRRKQIERMQEMLLQLNDIY